MRSASSGITEIRRRRTPSSRSSAMSRRAFSSPTFPERISSPMMAIPAVFSMVAGLYHLACAATRIPLETRHFMVDLLLRGGRVLDPSVRRDAAADILIRDGKVAAIGSGLAAPSGGRVVELKGLLVTPGLVDLHVHFREP